MAISLILDHFRAVAHWANSRELDAQLNMRTFELSIHWQGRQVRFHPLFSAKFGNRLVHVSSLSEHVLSFAGWLPYRPYTSPWSTDKLLFKRDVNAAGLRTPRQWAQGAQPDAAYIMKRSQGSFGYDLTGPFAAQEPAQSVAMPNPSGRGATFAEEFIEGQMAKIWFWGHRPFFVHLQDLPCITGDGQTSASQLAAAMLAQDSAADMFSSTEILTQCLRYQQVDPDASLPVGQRVWIDFRYGRTFQDRRRAVDANALSPLRRDCAAQLDAMGAFVARVLRETAPVPLMSSVDAVLDRENRLWWLEMNTNSILPHHGYELILSDLFNASEEASTSVHRTPTSSAVH